MSAAKIYFINRFYYPDMAATSQMLTDLSVGLAGHCDVTVITSRKLHNDPTAQLERQDEHRGVHILRLSTTRLGRAQLWRRAIDYASFYLRVMLFLLMNIRKGNIVVFMTDPPLLSLLNTTVVRLLGGRTVNWLQDIFPEIAMALGAFPSNRLLSRPLKWWRNKTLTAAKTNVVISGQMQKLLASQGVQNVVCIPNWADETAITPTDHAQNPLRKEWNLAEKFIVMYSGNFGRAHTFAEIADAVRQLTSEPHIQFLLVGEGAGLQALKQEFEDKGTGNVVFKPFQSKERLNSSLGAADLHLVTLKQGMEDLLMPSKLYGVLAAGRPVAFVGEQDGELAELVRLEQVGAAFAYGDGNGLASYIKAMASDAKKQEFYQKNARALFAREFTYKAGVRCWQELFAGLEVGIEGELVT